MWRVICILAGLLFAGDLIFWHLSILKTTMANATLMACLAPVWVALFSGILIGEKVPRNSFVGLAICLTGAFFLFGSSYQLAPERLAETRLAQRRLDGPEDDVRVAP